MDFLTHFLLDFLTGLFLTDFFLLDSCFLHDYPHHMCKKGYFGFCMLLPILQATSVNSKGHHQERPS